MAEKSKIIAFFLPQFHSIPENDKWWGAGFTEWTNVRRASALFKGHDQPKTPLEDNYYNLLDDLTLVNQCKQAQDHGIYGFSFYHYWFDGKLLLEKPIDLFIKSPDVKLKFCLTWANEPWSRTWDGRSKEVLMEQKYGDDESIRQHFSYLLKFFKDERYILKRGKPVLMLYRAESVPNLQRYISLFDELAVQNGLTGICWVFGNTVFNNSKNLDSRLESFSRYDLQPQEALGRRILCLKVLQSLTSRCVRTVNILLGKKIPIRMYDYDKIWKSVLSRDVDANCYYGAFVDWDNSPRRNQNGTIFRGFTIEKFHHYFSILYDRSCKEGKEYLFINAWNEWAEGAFLEPDQTNGNGKLEAIKSIVEELDD